MAETSLKKYSVVYKDNNGKLQEVNVKATSPDAIVRDFGNRGYSLVAQPEEISTSGLNMELSFGKKKVKPKDLAMFARKFSAMVDAGVPIRNVLSTLGNSDGQNPTMREVIKDLERSLNAGSTLSDAMAKHPTVFPPLVIAMVGAGESGGFLDKALRQVAEGLESEVKLRGKIKSAMTYPVVVLCMAVGICMAMMFFVVPIFDEMFRSLGSELPALTKGIVMVSNFLKVAIVPLVIVIIAILVWWRKNKHLRRIREIKDPLMLRIPIAGNLVRKMVMSRFSRNFATLQDNGVPILTTLEIVGGTTNSIVVEDALEDVSTKIKQGAKLSEAMRDHEIFPREDIEMIAIGEESGEIVGMLYKLAQMYDEEVEATTESLTSILEPVMIVFLGGMVGVMVVGLYLPIFSLSDAVKNSG